MVTFDSTAEAMAGRDVTHAGLWAMHRQRMVSLVERDCRDICGLHWLVRSEEIKIQARYDDRWSWMKKLAISGAFLQGHTLIISADGTVVWDGAEVVSTFPATFHNELVRLRYFTNHVFQAITNTPRKQWRRTGRDYQLKTMRIDLPQNVMLTVNVGELFTKTSFLDAFFTLPPPVGCDGHCGKADGNVSDDNTMYFRQRLSHWRVSPEDSLFGHQLSLASEVAMVLVRDEDSEMECVNGTRNEAWSLCRGVLPDASSADWVDACADDVCAGGPDMADRTLAVAAQAEESLAEEDNMATGSCRTCSPGDECFEDVAWAMEIGIPAGYYSDEIWVPELDSESCFEEVQRSLRIWQQDSALVAWMTTSSDPNIPAPCHSAATAHQKHGLMHCR